jgi:hypothetical protein
MNFDANTTSNHAPTASITEQTQARAVYDIPVLECHGQWTINLGINAGTGPLPE